MQQTQAAPVTAVVSAEHGTIVFRCPASTSPPIPLPSIARSQLLHDLADTGGAADVTEISVPVTWAALQQWLCHIQVRSGSSTAPTHPHPALTGDAAGGSPAEAGSKPIALNAYGDSAATAPIRASGSAAKALSGEPGGSPGASGGPVAIQHVKDAGLDGSVSEEDACALMSAADLLIDDRTKASCAHHLADLLHASPSASTVEAGKAMQKLPEHLQLVVFSHVPLPHCLSHLPATAHPLALRAHLPSIDSSASLHMPSLAIHHVPVALRAATSLPTVQDLSLSDLTLPLDGAPCMHLLRTFTALTSLCLHDVGLRLLTAAALATVLPDLHRLHALDLSSNLLAAPIMHALTPALAQCTALRKLNLWDTLSVAADAGTCLPPLAAAIRLMPHLSSFSASVCRWNARGVQRLHAAGCDELLATFHRLPDLRHLEIAVVGRDAPQAMPDDVPGDTAALTRLTHLTQLQSLYCAVPPCTVTPLPSSLGAHMTALTSLHLDVLAGTHAEDACAAAAHAAAILPELIRLHDLWLRVPIAREHMYATEPCQTLAEVLPRMCHLSRLQLLAGEMDVYGTVVSEPGGVSVAGVIDAAALLPQLRVLRVPVSIARGVHERVVKGLLQAAARVRLSIDLYVRVWDDSPIVLDTYVPLFPYVRTLDLWCCAGRDQLRPLASGRAALTQLRELRVEASVPVDTLVDRGPLADLLNHVSCLSTLERLHCMFDAVTQGAGAALLDIEDVLAGFPQSLCALTCLTSLHLDAGSVSTDFHSEMLRACAGLTRLQKLHFADVQWQVPVFKEVVQHLRLRKLNASDFREIEESAAEVAGLVRSMPHIRCILVASSIASSVVVAEALAASPALQAGNTGVPILM